MGCQIFEAQPGRGLVPRQDRVGLGREVFAEMNPAVEGVVPLNEAN